MKHCYVFIASAASDQAAVYASLETLNARVKAALNGQELCESSRIAMNRIVEGSNQHIAHLYGSHCRRLVGTVRVAEYH